MKLYLDAEHGKLSCNGSRTESSVSYESHSVSAHAVGSLMLTIPKSY